MNAIQKQVIKKSGTNMVCYSTKTLGEIKKDISKRLRGQKRAYEKNETKPKCLELQDDIREIIGDSVNKLQKTLDAIIEIEEAQ